MEQIGFIGAYDKKDLLINIAKVMNNLNKKVLIVDATTMQRFRYIVPRISNATNNTYVRETLDFKSPIQGEILKIYSADKVIYSKTLDMWKTHDGIDIEGKMGEAVYASERGTVEKIFNDSFLGMTVVISHIAGYKTSYSNLSENIPVVVGQQVKKSQRIGNISDTSIGEIKDSPHLHFMVFKNNETIDPSSVLD